MAKIDLSNYVYYTESDNSSTLNEKFVDAFFGIGGNRALLSPVKFKQKPKKEKVLVAYAHTLGFLDEKNRILISNVDKQLNYHKLILFITYLVAAITLVLCFELFQWNFFSTQVQAADIPLFIYLIGGFFMAIASILLIYILIFTALRLGSVIADRAFAEALCLAESLYIVFELEQDDVLLMPFKKSRLLGRVDYLAKKVLLMSLNYLSSDTVTKQWSQQHFKKIERYIRERERWIIAPQAKTLQMLRKDFYELAGIFLSGNYREIDWEKSTTPLDRSERPAIQRTIGGLLRFIGIVVPIGFFCVMIFYPNIFGVQSKTVSLIALVWLLLVVDASLNLHVVEHLVDVAKAFKEL